MKSALMFTTHDLYLASALKISGFKLLDIKKDQTGKGIFIFEDKPNRSNYLRDFFSGELKGSLKDYPNAWSDLKTLVNQL